MSNIIEIDVFHGTTRENANAILKSQQFITKHDRYHTRFLGEGIYFFDLKLEALDWNIGLYKKGKKSIQYRELLKNYSILEAKVRVRKKNCIDLNRREDRAIFCELTAKFKERIEKMEKVFKDSIKSDPKFNMDAFVINCLSELGVLNDIYLISAYYPSPMRKLYNSSGIKHVRRVICVKQNNIISDIKDCKYTKREYDGVVYFHENK